MYGIGPTEWLIIVAIGFLLFGAPVLTFLAGYTIGRRGRDAGTERTDAEVPAGESTTVEAGESNDE